MKNDIELRCIHRHTIDEHPSCFIKGRINYDFKNDREFEKLTGLSWWNFPGYKIGYFDIETDNLNADFGTVLSWCIKEKDGEIKYSVITRDELFTGAYDTRLIEEFIKELAKYKIIIGYYSDNFDLPFMRAKALHYGMNFPGYGELYTWDLYYTVKSKLKLSRKSLDAACDYLNIKGKTPLDRDVWRRAKYGEQDALDKVLLHNAGDVEILEKLHDRLEFTRKWLRKSI